MSEPKGSPSKLADQEKQRQARVIEAKQLAEKLTTIYKSLQETSLGDTVDPEVCKILQAPLCRLAKMIIPNVHVKIDEVIHADDYGFFVNPSPHGHDLLDADGNKVELKVSIATQKNKRCNFNWKLPKGASALERRQKLAKSIKEKTEGGYAVLIIKDGLARERFRFKLSESFLLAYFERIPLGKCDVHNMGCVPCKRCKKYHRLERFQQASNMMDNLTLVNWDELFGQNDKCL